jgi:hypothetical protein
LHRFPENPGLSQKLAFSVTDIGMIKIKGEKHVYEGNPFYFHRDEAFQNEGLRTLIFTHLHLTIKKVES